MKEGHVVYEVIVVVLVLMAVMIAYMKFSGKPLVQRADQAETNADALTLTPEPEPIEPAEPQVRVIPDEIPTLERSFLENEAYTVFAYGSYHSMLPTAILPPASPYPQVDPARDSAALRPQGEEEILIHDGVFTGYIPATHLTESNDLCAALAQPNMLSLRVCGTDGSCIDGNAEQQNHSGVAFVLFDPAKASNVYYSASSGMVTVKDIDISALSGSAEYTVYDSSVLVVTAEQLASAAACF
jgi:hypothetical protein